MGWLVGTRELVAQYAGGLATHVQLTTTNPTDGAAGTAAAVARVPIVWTSGGEDGRVTATVTFDNVPAGTYRGVDFYSAASGGTRRGWDLLRNPGTNIPEAITFTSTGRLTATFELPVTNP